MKKHQDKRVKRDNTPWGDESFEDRRKKGTKGLSPAKRFRTQDLHFEDEV